MHSFVRSFFIYIAMETCFCHNLCQKKTKLAADMEALKWSGFHCKRTLEVPRTTWTENYGSRALPRSRSSLVRSHGLTGISCKLIPSKLSPGHQLGFSPMPFLGGSFVPKKVVQVLYPNVASPGLAVELLDAWDDEYEGVIIDPEGLPLSANAFASALRASLLNWKLKGKKGIWLKILLEQTELVPIAIQEGFSYHHAEAGYVMLTYWIPNEPVTLPSGPSHQIGIAGFVINDKGEVLVVKETCPCSCSGIWKLPTGYINKSEDIFSGAVREVKEETGVDTMFLEMVAFRHAHLVAFEKSDLLFVCMLKPLSSEITIDEKEIQAAKWMPVNELLGQPFYTEDQMSKRIIEICMATNERDYSGFIAHKLASRFDGNMFYLYYNEKYII
ncbi:Nudix hydrolase [Actinidia chinensis var. chinensis]|uniref:Nudix hydrolase n=1 Tax=Actinidia chinensis var. chinensis TaxID=1590841 RepID=A0A2R6R4B9_ACTCC|nr:Nudix hydrolase [Actinidia chinensis var. chinensis]